MDVNTVKDVTVVSILTFYKIIFYFFYKVKSIKATTKEIKASVLA